MNHGKATRVLYLDLDGTVRHGFDELGHFVNKAEDVVVFPESLAKMRAAHRDGWRIVGISNQGGIALGHLSMKDCAGAMVRTHELCEKLFTKIAFCQHHPDAQDPEYSACWCRKPKIGLIVETMTEMGRLTGEYYPPHMSLFVGDRDEDRLCAENASIPFQWAKDWRASA